MLAGERSDGEAMEQSRWDAFARRRGEVMEQVGSDSFTSWYLAEHPKVLAVLCAVSGDPETARESTDEAFTRCFARWAEVSAMASPTGWTYRVALNALRRTLWRRSLERHLLARLAGPPPVVEPAYGEVRDLLAVLTARQRTAVVLRYVADLPEADIATAMGVRRGTVTSTLADARRRLASHLGAEVTPHA